MLLLSKCIIFVLPQNALTSFTLGSYCFHFLISTGSSHWQEGKKTLERELARAKVSANRVATVVANSWKDSQDKLMPVKQWLDERRFMQVIK